MASSSRIVTDPIRQDLLHAEAVVPGARRSFLLPGTVAVLPIRPAAKEHPVPHRTVTIASSVGLHARPASVFAREVAATGVPVQIARPGASPVDAASLLLVMGLGLQHGEPVEIAAEGDGADAALDRLADLLATDLDATA
jgi:phosphocarrier protein